MSNVILCPSLALGESQRALTTRQDFLLYHDSNSSKITVLYNLLGCMRYCSTPAKSAAWVDEEFC